MAKGWTHFGTINKLTSNAETHSEYVRRMRKFDTIIRTTPTRDAHELKEYVEECYKKKVAEDEHILDVVENKRTTNKELIQRAEKLKKERTKEKKVGSKENGSND